ncbi:peptide chain release factor N(5)-glutamine methyltransferase [Geosporobacter ferrireducens]|uniref:Release factor glutamine methyltransferase n=1 Tax=Geosporobacter ferrireducens TaxID=1424294 RepID=A0A1D8GGT8_9FIRM|nr:peptide chain release factor N(5)-glutamine methyltransferase [Geosporobacter ferrireducens]AOT70093.1 protein-(glutamine-N5) methyltransferase, release factor-specific [Geosporobacter ferrireducens]
MVRTVQEVLKDAVDRLEKTGAWTPLLDAEVLLCEVLGIDRLYLYIQRGRSLSGEERDSFEALLEKRIQGVPLQYITHRQEFMGLDFYVEEGVLIPRADTEILVEAVLQWVAEEPAFKAYNATLNIVDLGTGSGTITVSLAKYIEKVHVYSVDLSEKALSIGRKNAEQNGVLDKITFLQGDLMQPLMEKGLFGQIDILVSNPPYIPAKDIDGLQVEVAKFEPRMALDGGADGLDFYRRIVAQGDQLLRHGGRIALEVGHDQADSVKNMMANKKNYANIKKYQDLAGIERVVAATVI